MQEIKNKKLRTKFENVTDSLIEKTKEGRLSWIEVDVNNAISRYEWYYGELNEKTVAVEEREGRKGVTQARKDYWLILLNNTGVLESHKSTVARKLFGIIKRKQNNIKEVIEELKEQLENL